MPSRPDPPYLRIAAELGARIRSGELSPGARLPSIRQIAARWGVAVATATRVVATLRDEGLVETKVGAGTVVCVPPIRRAGPSGSRVEGSDGWVESLGGEAERSGRRRRPGGRVEPPGGKTGQTDRQAEPLDAQADRSDRRRPGGQAEPSGRQRDRSDRWRQPRGQAGQSDQRPERSGRLGEQPAWEAESSDQPPGQLDRQPEQSGWRVGQTGRQSNRQPGRPGRRAQLSDRRVLNRDELLQAAVAVADGEGLGAVSMRRVAAELGTGPMSLYRYVTNKDELVAEMADQIFGECALPVPGPAGWRAKLDLIAREQWALCRRHHWLPGAVSFTRPSLTPGMMAHTEWTLRALDGLDLSLPTKMHEALTLHSLVLSVALSAADEVEAEQETGVTLTRWLQAQRKRAGELFADGRFPLLAKAHEETVPDLDGLFEYSLGRHLDGFAVLVRERPGG